MKTLPIIVISSIIFYFGCSSTYTQHNGEFSWKELEETVNEKNAQLVRTDSEQIGAQNINISGKIIYFTDKTSPSMQLIPLQQVEKIIIKSHPRGALDGLVFGALGGFILGGVAGRPGMYGGFAAVSGLGVGILVGSLVGGIIGHTNTYILAEKERQSKKHVTIEVQSIEQSNESSYIVVKGLHKARILISQVKKIERRDNRIYITIPVHLYEEKFR